VSEIDLDDGGVDGGFVGRVRSPGGATIPCVLGTDAEIGGVSPDLEP
jgi:hypothetical protein